MTEEDMEHVKDLFDKWLDTQSDLCEIPMTESLGNAYFDAYEKAQQETSCQKAYDMMEEGLIKYICTTQNTKNCTASKRLDEALKQIEKMKCCENCKFWIDNDCVIEHDYDCKRWNNHNTDDYWELAE